MPSSQQAALLKPVEPLQITVPTAFAGARTNPDASQLYVSTEYQIYTSDEIALIDQYLTKLPYPQSLILGALFIDEYDPLLAYSHDQLDAIEKQESLSLTRKAPGGGERATRERVLILRESGYSGVGARALSGSH